MIDLHCHILAHVDDGPDNLIESLKIAECAAADGIRTIVATPHSQNGVYLNPPTQITKHLTRLKQEIKREGIPVNIYAGAEVRIHQDMEHSLEKGQIASINDTGQYILVEFPHDVMLPRTRDVLFQLSINHITPILAHPERNTTLQRNPDVLAGFVDMGCLVQLTAMSITGEFGSDAMAYAHLLLKEGRAHVIASDAHDAKNRPPILSPAVKEAARILGDLRMAEAMVNQNPRAILHGKPINLPEPQKAFTKKRWWGRWLARGMGM
ncbi:MAG: CpsB/CapC family capsule biosynthesis tyrosine phosphatase [Thermodesulfobacteriota bacterium]